MNMYLSRMITYLSETDKTFFTLYAAGSFIELLRKRNDPDTFMEETFGDSVTNTQHS